MSQCGTDSASYKTEAHVMHTIAVTATILKTQFKYVLLRRAKNSGQDESNCNKKVGWNGVI